MQQIRSLRGVSARRNGYVIITALVFGTIGILLIVGLVSWASLSLRVTRKTLHRERALQVAEAGVDYYRWHLAHDPDDYQDGTGGAGPYVHSVKDKNGTVIGQFSLTVVPPPVGSSVVTITSTGSVTAEPGVSRTIETKLGIASLAQYAVVANADIRFGTGTEIFGLVHSNGGIRFDALSHNLVTSARSDYDDPDHTGANEFGVHTHVTPTDPLPPSPVPARPDVFAAGRTFPVPAVDFAGLSADLAKMRSDAIAGGRFFAASGNLGYHFVLKTTDRFDVYRVTATRNPPQNCINPGQTGWGSWSIASGGETLIQSNVAFPNNGIIFAEDHVWVSGQINGARLTIAAALFPDSPLTRKSVTINNDLTYTNTDGTDVIGIIAQNNVNVGLFSEDDIRIDAALVAQNGRVGRYLYTSPSCAPNAIRQKLTLYGMIATNQRYGFAYTDGTGYQIRNISYDANLLFNPPPSFPLTADDYETISWEEIAAP
jgi:hypothetical protein